MFDRLGQLCAQTNAGRLQEYLVFAGQLHLKTRPKACPGNYSICVLDFIRSLHTRVRLTSLVTVTEDLQVSIFDTIMTMITASSGGIQDDGGVIFTSPLASADPGLRS